MTLPHSRTTPDLPPETAGTPDDDPANHPDLQAWVTAAARGDAAQLLILGPVLAGKTRALHAARHLLRTAGVSARDISENHEFTDIHDTGDDETTTRPSAVLANRIVLIDAADRYATLMSPTPAPGADHPGYEPRHASGDDDPTLEDAAYLAELNARAGDLRNIVSKLTFSLTHAALLTATSADTVRSAFEDDLADRVLAWPTLHLPDPDTSDIVTW